MHILIADDGGRKKVIFSGAFLSRRYKMDSDYTLTIDSQHIKMHMNTDQSNTLS